MCSRCLRDYPGSGRNAKKGDFWSLTFWVTAISVGEWVYTPVILLYSSYEYVEYISRPCIFGRGIS